MLANKYTARSITAESNKYITESLLIQLNIIEHDYKQLRSNSNVSKCKQWTLKLHISTAHLWLMLYAQNGELTTDPSSIWLALSKK